MIIERPTQNIPVKGVSIHGKDLKKLFEYCYEIETRWDAHDVRYRNMSRLDRPSNPYGREAMTIQSCISALGVWEEYLLYRDKRRAVDPYWVERDAKNNYTPAQ